MEFNKYFFSKLKINLTSAVLCCSGFDVGSDGGTKILNHLEVEEGPFSYQTKDDIKKLVVRLLIESVFRILIRIRIWIHRIHMFLGLPDPNPDPIVRGMGPEPDPDPSISKQ